MTYVGLYVGSEPRCACDKVEDSLERPLIMPSLGLGLKTFQNGQTDIGLPFCLLYH